MTKKQFLLFARQVTFWIDNYTTQAKNPIKKLPRHLIIRELKKKFPKEKWQLAIAVLKDRGILK